MTWRVSPVALRNSAHESSMRTASGPATSIMPFTGCRDGDVGQRRGDVIRDDRLHQRGRQPNRFSGRAGLRDAADELEELRGADDRVGNRGGLDQILLAILARK